MPMSSPARSSASATSAGQGGGSSSNAAFGDDTPPYHFPADLVSPHEHMEEALAVLKSDLIEALQKEVKSFADDNWMFAGPRSQVILISRPSKSFEFDFSLLECWMLSRLIYDEQREFA